MDKNTKMFDIDKVKGIIFDYGGTIDSNGMHWAEVIWNAYQKINVPVTKEEFRDAYVYTERYLAVNPVIQSNHNFYDLLKIKIDLQINNLVENNKLNKDLDLKGYSSQISKECYNFAKQIIDKEIIVLENLKSRYPMVLVSNFYGNVQAVLEDFGLLSLFDKIIESAIVGVRKPDPEIFRLGVEELNLSPDSIVVIGDSYSKDIVPATKNGCQTIWLKGLGWGDDDANATADLVIKDFMELKSIFKLN